MMLGAVDRINRIYRIVRWAVDRMYRIYRIDRDMACAMLLFCIHPVDPVHPVQSTPVYFVMVSFTLPQVSIMLP